jgi:hypothetical protein
MKRRRQTLIEQSAWPLWPLTFGFLVMMGYGCASTSLNPVLAEQFAQLTEWRSKAESWAYKLRLDTSKHGTEEFHKAEDLYIDAKGAVDAWIDSFRLNLTAVTEEDNKAAFERGAAKSREFIRYVKSMYVKGLAGTEAGELLVAIGVGIYREYKAAGEERKAAIKAELERVRWKSFNEIKF